MVSLQARAAAVALAALAGTAQAAPLAYVEGQARDPSDQQLLYREQHLVRRADGRAVERLVVYRCADGTAFARKRVDYRDSAQAPSFDFEDARHGYGEGLRREGTTELAWVREGAGAAEQSAALDESLLVADAGFDEFIRVHWAALVAGDKVPLRFAVPARLQSLGFTLQRVREARIDGRPVEVFRLRLGGLLGWVAPSIDVAYEREGRRLRRFEGLSNLRADDGVGQLAARIDFPEPERQVPASRWQALATEPLSACRVRGSGRTPPDSPSQVASY